MAKPKPMRECHNPECPYYGRRHCHIIGLTVSGARALAHPDATKGPDGLLAYDIPYLVKPWWRRLINWITT